MHEAIDWNREFGGQALASEYPYRGNDGSCDMSAKKHGHVAMLWDLRYHNVKDLEDAAKQGAVAVGVNAAPWKTYREGVMSAASCPGDEGSERPPEEEDLINHGVVLVGWGTEGSEDFWVIRNSWGMRWGEKGYMRLQRDHFDWKSNACGITEVNTEPYVA